ncbi:DUF3379 domain-containing protein [Parahaliea aestuarii]|uniref:DUF3379 domain-containing protein n=1 Tax=Parahaliea aestuarii TaxID=1852021 RepID=A0A5C9A5K0_9GAMM|nr:DUF3379 domain-containing protein [Parahaliea aestuarii]TXS94431.1 DUF3379 domain-containing protein [Parahaliea aestuarii]
MLSDFDKQRLQAGFDGELTSTEWRQLQDEFRDSAEAREWLAELESLRSALAGAPEVPVPKDLAAAIKARIPASEGNVRRVDFAAPRNTARPLWGGLALAASLVVAVGVGMQFWGVAELGTDSQLRSRMTGTLLDAAAMEAQRHWQWQGMDARALLVRDNTGLVLELELDAQPAADLVLSLDGEQWRWRQDVAGRRQSDAKRPAAEMRLAVAGEERYRLEIEPDTRDGVAAQGTLPAPRIHVRMERDGHSLDRGTIEPD